VSEGKQKPNRKSIRLKEYDYTHPGAYFVTICTHHRKPVFGRAQGDEIVLNEFGMIAEYEWNRTASVRDEMACVEHVVMPNHLHGIVIINDVGQAAQKVVGAHGRAPLHRPPRSLGSFVAGFKARVTKKVNLARGTPGNPLWQRNYYERVIRDEDELNRAREYIRNNPLNWQEDEYHPDKIRRRA
jgi:putative transposase